ncbi:M1 family metallopeptidase [Mucilaginibacter achroorhodeus]|uniref:Aminopeptidase N n=1 Tax=Mucilaginibacter achroorhodeus TaxID=2599294 RepID=A0A563UB00_9SPHI|nr:M1 family metallopeptidase [Mucilaginibacter achroorhodeus]TWR28518.1 M1 family metallopeptidase [Mucilaginibacter achroorhodeus]
MRIRLSLLVSFVFAAQVYAQQPGPAIDVQNYRFGITLTDATNLIKGDANITTKILRSTREISFDLTKKNATGKGMLVSKVKEAGKSLKFTQDSAHLVINTVAVAGTTHTYHISYEGIPSDGLIISTNHYGKRTFFGDNWPNRAHNWLPCVDAPADKASLEFDVTAPAKYTVVANGLKIAEQQLPGGNKLTRWKETARLPAKVMVIGVAEFAVDKVASPDNVPVSTYVFPEDQEVGFRSYAVAAEILPWFAKRIGTFPYKKLANVQSKTIFGGMENAGAIFYFEESVKDKGIEALMAHEIAHQWFGDAISEKNWQHVWLSEGFATYMTNLYLESKYGVDSLNKRLMADRKQVFNFEKSYNAPVVDSAFKGSLMKLLSPNAYQKGGWVLHMLRRKVGDEAFWKGIAAYYKQYNGGNANTDNFRIVMEKASGQDLKNFFNQWLRTAGHPILKMTRSYDDKTKEMVLHIDQETNKPFNFTLEVSVDGKLYKREVKDVITDLKFPAGSATAELKLDPNTNLLASFVDQSK